MKTKPLNSASILRSVYNAVDRVIINPSNSWRIYQSLELDRTCQNIGNENLKTIKPEKNTPGDFVYIVSKLQRSGGHTRVLSDFIRARPDAKHVILATHVCGPSDQDTIEKLSEKYPVSFEAAPRKNFQKRLSWLQRRLLEASPEKVYLFNHHQDSVAIAAVQPQMDCKFSFYHHGDHHLCLGASIKDIEHIDFHPFGFYNCRDRFAMENTYIPLTMEDRGARPQKPFLQNQKLTTCTVGRYNKVEVNYPISYLDAVPKLLQATGGRHIHIGKLTPWGLCKLRRNLKKMGVRPEQFVYIPWVSSVWQAVQDHGVDLYIASFPYGGALTLIEVMGAGIPVTLHENVFGKAQASVSLAYPGAFIWREPEELFDYCQALTSETLQAQSLAAREQYQRHHKPEILKESLLNIELSEEALRVKRPEHKQDSMLILPESMLAACWRFIYRHLRLARARCY